MIIQNFRLRGHLHAKPNSLKHQKSVSYSELDPRSFEFIETDMDWPILKTLQSAKLGIHTIQERAVVINSNVEERPLLYLALSCENRIINGREAVTLLVRIKECIEETNRLLFEILRLTYGK